MPDSLRSSITRRRYRLAQAITVAGSLAVGSLVVNRLVALFREDFFLFYGVSDTQYRLVQEHADGQLPLTVGKLMVAAIALASVWAFVWNERRRLRQDCDISRASCSRRRALVQERLSFNALFDILVLRTSAFAGVLLMLWLLQTSLERWLGGFGWGLEYADWRSLLPLASVFGVCVLAGMLVAAVSLVGLRAIHVLEVVLDRIRRRLRPVSSRKPKFAVLHGVRTLRELIGNDILTRPPPVAC